VVGSVAVSQGAMSLPLSDIFGPDLNARSDWQEK
jgi:hypothetical protein